MFMVFTTAANDEKESIVQLAFETVEKIVRHNFTYITETESSTFTDCCNCLMAFTNNRHSLDVALNSIAFLRYCAIKLAEGAIGDMDELPEGADLEPKTKTRIVSMGTRVGCCIGKACMLCCSFLFGVYIFNIFRIYIEISKWWRVYYTTIK